MINYITDPTIISDQTLLKPFKDIQRLFTDLSRCFLRNVKEIQIKIISNTANVYIYLIKYILLCMLRERFLITIYNYNKSF